MEEGGKDVPVTWRTTAGNGRWRRRHARATGDTPPRPAPTLPLFSAAAAEGLPPLSFLPRQHAPRRLLGGGGGGSFVPGGGEEGEAPSPTPPPPRPTWPPAGAPTQPPTYASAARVLPQGLARSSAPRQRRPPPPLPALARPSSVTPTMRDPPPRSAVFSVQKRTSRPAKAPPPAHRRRPVGLGSPARRTKNHSYPMTGGGGGRGAPWGRGAAPRSDHPWTAPLPWAKGDIPNRKTVADGWGTPSAARGGL